MKRDVQENDEEAVQVKEQSILELGSLLAKTGQAEGKSCVWSQLIGLHLSTTSLEQDSRVWNFAMLLVLSVGFLPPLAFQVCLDKKVI